jgi:hypothetical protein
MNTNTNTQKLIGECQSYKNQMMELAESDQKRIGTLLNRTGGIGEQDIKNILQESKLNIDRIMNIATLSNLKLKM